MKERWPEMLEYQQKVQAMTDLERAYALVHSDPERIEAALAAARREGAEAEREWIDVDAFRRGAEEMRERAARWFEAALKPRIADAIRALPLTPEEPT